MGGKAPVEWPLRRSASRWLFALAVALAVLAMVVEQTLIPGWLPWALSVVSVIGGLTLARLHEAAVRRDDQDRQLDSSTKSLDGGTMPLVRDAADAALNRPAAAGYLRRDLHDQLREQLLEGKPVLVRGHSLSGKTRLAFEVVRELYGDWQIWIPERPDGLASLMSQEAVPTGVVVWLDDLDAFLRAEQQPRLAWLSRMQTAGCRVVATMRASEYEAFSPRGELTPPQWELLQRFVVLDLTHDRSEQHRIASGTGSTLATGIRRYGVAEYLGGGPLAQHRYRTGQSTRPLAIAMLRAAADWRRLGLDDIAESTLIELAPHYLAARDRSAAGTTAEALAWASEELGGRIQLLCATPSGWAIFDYLLDLPAHESAPIPHETWTAALMAAEGSGSFLLHIGIRAYLAGSLAEAADAWTRATRAGGQPAAQAAFNLGVVHTEDGRLDQAAAAYQLAIDSTIPDHASMAAVNLGALFERAGTTNQAATAYQVAIESGHPDHAPNAADNLGVLHARAGRGEQAAAAFQIAIDSAHPIYAPSAAFNLGVVYDQAGEDEQAAAAYQVAIEFPQSDQASRAADNLGVLHARAGRDEQAAAAFQLAVDLGHHDYAPSAAANLGVLHARAGRSHEAAAAYRLAINSAHPDHAPKALIGLALVHEEVDQSALAAAAYQLAIDSAHPDLAPAAAINLGTLQAQAGDYEQAAATYQLAIDSAHPDHAAAAAVNLGLLHVESGDDERAAAAYQLAIKSAHYDQAPRAAALLKQLREERRGGPRPA